MVEDLDDTRWERHWDERANDALKATKVPNPRGEEEKNEESKTWNAGKNPSSSTQWQRQLELNLRRERKLSISLSWAVRSYRFSFIKLRWHPHGSLIDNVKLEWD